MDQNVILSRLLDKYENSKHLSQPGVSARRVMLRTEKKEFPEYRYEDASVRDICNRLAIELEQKGWVTLEWVKNRPVISVIALRLDHVMECYRQNASPGACGNGRQTDPRIPGRSFHSLDCRLA